MDPLQLEVIDSNHTHLVASLRANDVIDWLLKEGAITRFEYDQLRRTEAQGARAMNRLLILTLRRKGGNAYPSLLRAMRSSGQDHLCDVILSSEHNIHDGIRADIHEQKFTFAHHHGSHEKNNGFGPGALEVRAGTSGTLHGTTTLAARQPVRSPLTPPTQGNDYARSLWSSQTAQQRKAETPSTTWQHSPPPSPPRLQKPHISREPSLQFKHPSSKETPQESRQTSAQYKTPPASAYSANPQSEAGQDAEVQRLQRELNETRQSQSKTESELRHQIQQMEKDKQSGQNTGKSCVVM
eukprot:GHVL01010475.1.p1 GENE.GHVL01010475.1~~GHVL01010475.1.p1  ORF type:complete len:297 (-),score=16.64 GHVL01010475.1:444-1334(-)